MDGVIYGMYGKLKMLWSMHDAIKSCGLLILDKPAKLFTNLERQKHLELLG